MAYMGSDKVFKNTLERGGYEVADLYGVRTLYYDEYSNRMVDEDGRIIYDVFRIISPSFFYLWKKRKGVYYFRPKKNTYIIYRFIFPFEDDEYDEYYFEN
jgi:hypothetical protein